MVRRVISRLAIQPRWLPEQAIMWKRPTWIEVRRRDCASRGPRMEFRGMSLSISVAPSCAKCCECPHRYITGALVSRVEVPAARGGSSGSGWWWQCLVNIGWLRLDDGVFANVNADVGSVEDRSRPWRQGLGLHGYLDVLTRWCRVCEHITLEKMGESVD